MLEQWKVAKYSSQKRAQLYLHYEIVRYFEKKRVILKLFSFILKPDLLIYRFSAVIYAFEQALLCLGYYPEIWYEAALFMQKAAQELEVRQISMIIDFLSFNYRFFSAHPALSRSRATWSRRARCEKRRFVSVLSQYLLWCSGSVLGVASGTRGFESPPAQWWGWWQRLEYWMDTDRSVRPCGKLVHMLTLLPDFFTPISALFTLEKCWCMCLPWSNLSFVRFFAGSRPLGIT